MYRARAIFAAVLRRRSISPPLQRLMAHHTEEVSSHRRPTRIIGTCRTQQFQEALLHDIFSVRHRSLSSCMRSGTAADDAHRTLQESRFPALTGCIDQIHACLDSITARVAKESSEGRKSRVRVF